MSTRTRSVLITGCTPGGIGFALAQEFHAKGLRVFATARRVELLSSLADVGVTTLALDVTDIVAIRKVRDQVSAATGGKLDILVNNAGQDYPVAFTDSDMSEIRDLFEVNVFGPMAMIQEFVKLLIASKDGRILQTGSILGIMPLPFSAAYNGTKAAIHALSNSLRVELAPFNIKVINLIAGTVATNLFLPREIPADSYYKPMEHLYLENRMKEIQVDATDPNTLAKFVVAQTLAPTPRAWIWAGKYALLTWIFETFLPRTAFDWLMRRNFGFSEFAKMVSDGKVKTD